MPPKPNVRLQSQTRKIIYDVTQYMKKEKEEGVKDVDKVYLRVSNATGVSQRTIQRIAYEGKSGLASVFRTPGKKRPRAKPITDVNNLDQGVIRRCLHNFHNTEKVMPSVTKLVAKLRREIDFQGCDTSLGTILKKLGFKWRKSGTKAKILIEKTDIRLKRILYLKTIKQYRDEGRPIVFTDELYARLSNTKGIEWSDGSNEGMKHPTSKAQQIVTIHAGSEAGFVPNAKTFLHINDMNFMNYEKWLQTQLIPNLSPNSVVVIDDAPYHNKIINAAPTPNDKRAKMELWLLEKGIPYEKDMCKPQLYDLIKKNKGDSKMYVIDEILKKYNHDVLRLPPFHPDLNLMEMVWAAIKEYVASKYVEWDITKAMDFVQEKINSIGPKEWSDYCAKIKEIEDEYRKSDLIIDEMTDEHYVHPSSDWESETESESDECVDEPMIIVEVPKLEEDPLSESDS